MSDTPQMTDIFNFMELRSAFQPEDKSLQRSYIYDNIIGTLNEVPARIDVDIQTKQSPSAIGRLVYEQIFCTKDAGNMTENIGNLLDKVLTLLTPYMPRCTEKDTGSDSPSSGGGSVAATQPLSIQDLERNAYIVIRNSYYLIPYRLEMILDPAMAKNLISAYKAVNEAVADSNSKALLKKLSKIFAVNSIRELVFNQGKYSSIYRETKRKLFDALYVLYILRRRVYINLEQVIDGLRVLHVLEALAIDELIEAIKSGTLSAADAQLRTTIESVYPELVGWRGTNALPDLPLIGLNSDLNLYLNATPVIHPIFARLHWYKFPFNNIKPIGVGDLKVVKQWLVEYLPGEISHIENVLKSEIRDRTHRRLEKIDQTYTTTTSIKEETQKDTQSTERADLKREVENIVKSELNVGANLSVTYNGTPVKSTVSGNFSYKTESNAREKSNADFFREVISKAVQRVEKNVTETRSIASQFETEETNKHSFENNKINAKNIVGIYRWVDKKYKAQLFNYGRRMMFEFMIPEPAAFFVEARLRAYEASMECPQPPKNPVYKAVNLNFTPQDIDQTKFNALRQEYDLAEFTFPEVNRKIIFNNPDTGQAYFKESGVDGGSKWYAKTYTCRVNLLGYQVTNILVSGFMEFQGRNEADPREKNTFEIYLDGSQIVRVQDESILWWQWNPGAQLGVSSGTVFDSNDVALTLGFWDIGNYYLSITADATLGPQVILNWQTQVYNKIRAIEQKSIDAVNQELLLNYNSQLMDYRNRLSELKAQAVNDLLQGQSEAFNSELINAELKKHCLTLLTKEFDTDNSDDVVASMGAMKTVTGNFVSRKFTVNQDSTIGTTTCGFDTHVESIDYPAIDIIMAQRKGNYIQFLEQAFEWRQMAYVFYPYFWANQSKWIELLSRSDQVDPNLTAFLQAGSCKVLLAATPAYENAVLHYLATREPWSGGPAPVIGDPLYIPLYEEIRKNQDDLRDATPEGEPWTFTLPTSLVMLDDKNVELPTFPDGATGG